MSKKKSKKIVKLEVHETPLMGDGNPFPNVDAKKLHLRNMLDIVWHECCAMLDEEEEINLEIEKRMPPIPCILLAMLDLEEKNDICFQAFSHAVMTMSDMVLKGSKDEWSS